MMSSATWEGCSVVVSQTGKFTMNNQQRSQMFLGPPAHSPGTPIKLLEDFQTVTQKQDRSGRTVEAYVHTIFSKSKHTVLSTKTKECSQFAICNLTIRTRGWKLR